MDHARFDTLTRALSAGISRRRGMRILLAAFAGGAIALDGDGAGAARATCRPNAAACLRHSQCCSSLCDTRRTTPRARRNRCICKIHCTPEICGSDGCGGTCPNLCSDDQVCHDGLCCTPDCEGKVCGDDGCGGTCGSCKAGQGCFADGALCEWPCEVGEAATWDWCQGDGSGNAWETFEFFDRDIEQACSADADCADFHPMCIGNPDERKCICLLSVGGGWQSPDGNGECAAIAVVPSACKNTPYQGKPYCSDVIDGSRIGFSGFAAINATNYAGWRQTCATSAECVAADLRCTDPGRDCVCITSAGPTQPIPAQTPAYQWFEAQCHMILT